MSLASKLKSKLESARYWIRGHSSTIWANQVFNLISNPRVMFVQSVRMFTCQVKHGESTKRSSRRWLVSPLTLRIFCCRLSIPSAPLVKSRPTPSSPTLSTTSRLDSEPPRRMGTGMLRTSQLLRSACGHTRIQPRENYKLRKKKVTS